tara:strand:+ start:130 stop:234 length:105 start_codon:yes stop_codon:yes gene_type:complete
MMVYRIDCISGIRMKGDHLAALMKFEISSKRENY